MDAVVFRVWEGALAALLGATALLLTVRIDRLPVVTGKSLLWPGAAVAVLFFVNPPLGLAAYCNLGLLLLRRVPIKRWVRAMALILVVSLFILTPWTALVPSLPYMVPQPIARYRYIIFLPLLFLAVEFLSHLLARANIDRWRSFLPTASLFATRSG